MLICNDTPKMGFPKGLPLTGQDPSTPRCPADTEQVRTAYLDLMRDSLIGRLNGDPALPSGKVEGYKDAFREEGWDWPSKAPSMIGAKRMQNVRSECERLLKEGAPGDFIADPGEGGQ